MTNRLMAGMNLKGKGGKVAYKSMEMYKLIQGKYKISVHK